MHLLIDFRVDETGRGCCRWFKSKTESLFIRFRFSEVAVVVYSGSIQELPQEKFQCCDTANPSNEDDDGNEMSSKAFASTIE
jgi:hypothetical protein